MIKVPVKNCLAAIVLIALTTCKKTHKQTNSELSLTTCTCYKEYRESRLPSTIINDRCQRTRDEIKNTISSSIPKLKTLIRKYPNIAGQIILSVGVNNCGNVDTCFVKTTNVMDTVFVNEVIETVKMVRFNKIDLEDDYCLFDYPFYFAQKEVKN